MQRTDLDKVAELFDLAGDGVDDVVWAQRFHEHVSKVMRTHGANLRSGGSSAEQQLELVRARLELSEIVADRLEQRAERVDPVLAEALRRLRASRAPLVAEAIRLQKLPPPGDPYVGRAPMAKLQASSPRCEAGATPAPMTPRAGARNRLGQSPRGAAGVTEADRSRLVPSPRGAPATPEPDEAAPEASGTRANPRTGGYAQLHEARRNKEANARPWEVGGSSRPGKELTLRQLRTIISMVYASKAQRDERCAEADEQRETMEHHLYSFLGKRYGARASVEEWARAIFRAIEREAPRECDVAVFGKILQNRLAENFAPVQDALCKTLNGLLRKSLQQRHPQRSPTEIEAMGRNWMRNGVPASEVEAAARYMYDEGDSERVLSRLREATSAAQEGGVALVRYRDLVQILITFQMQLTEDFLSHFVQLFAQIDADDDGVASTAQLQELLELMAEAEGLDADAAEALAQAKAETEVVVCRLKSATFSECVEVFNGMIVARAGSSGHAGETVGELVHRRSQALLDVSGEESGAGCAAGSKEVARTAGEAEAGTGCASGGEASAGAASADGAEEPSAQAAVGTQWTGSSDARGSSRDGLVAPASTGVVDGDSTPRNRGVEGTQEDMLSGSVGDRGAGLQEEGVGMEGEGAGVEGGRTSVKGASGEGGTSIEGEDAGIKGRVSIGEVGTSAEGWRSSVEGGGAGVASVEAQGVEERGTGADTTGKWEERTDANGKGGGANDGGGGDDIAKRAPLTDDAGAGEAAGSAPHFLGGSRAGGEARPSDDNAILEASTAG